MVNPLRKKGKSGARKHGRNKDKCDKYKMAGRREENKKRKARKHAKRLEYLVERREVAQED